MSDEDFVIRRRGANPLAEDEEFEQLLEALISIAQLEGREFLAYLLRMALIEARNHNPPHTYLSH